MSASPTAILPTLAQIEEASAIHFVETEPVDSLDLAAEPGKRKDKDKGKDRHKDWLALLLKEHLGVPLLHLMAGFSDVDTSNTLYLGV